MLQLCRVYTNEPMILITEKADGMILDRKLGARQLIVVNSQTYILNLRFNQGSSELLS